MNFTTDQWVILLLVFVLGLLIGGFLFTGGGRKWKHRYNAEVDRRRDLEKTYATNEKDWREQDSRRDAALRDAERKRPISATPVAAVPVADVRDTNRDGVVTANEASVSPVVSDSRVSNRDGVVDDDEATRPEGGLLRRKPGRADDGTITSGSPAMSDPKPAGGFVDKILGRDRDRDTDGVPDRKE